MNTLELRLVLVLAIWPLSLVTGCGPSLIDVRSDSIVDQTGTERFRCTRRPTKDGPTGPEDFVTTLEALERAQDHRNPYRLVLDGRYDALAVSPDGGTVAVAVAGNRDQHYRIVLVDHDPAGGVRIAREIPMPPGSFDTGPRFQIRCMDMVGRRLAVYTFSAAGGTWREVVGIIDLDRNELVSACGPIPWKFEHRFELDVSLSPDGNFVAFYGYYLVPQFPRSVDVFWPYSQKEKGYLAVYRVQDGKLIEALDNNVFMTETPWDPFRIKADAPGRAFRVKKRLQLGWTGAGSDLRIRLPDGSSVGCCSGTAMATRPGA